MTKTERVAVYGGTFNPPHVGHVRSAEALSRAINPDKLLIIPAFLPPHKEMDSSVSPEDRLQMCRLAFSHIKNAEISDLEILRGGKSYTCHTLQELTRPDRELYFLCGTDMFLTMSSWYRPELIFALSTVCFVRREEDKATSALISSTKERYEREFNAKIIEISSDVIELSSSELRNSINDLRTKALLQREVYEYINERGLY